MDLLPYRWINTENSYFEKFKTVRTRHRIDAMPAHAIRSGPRVNHMEEIRVTLDMMLRNHAATSYVNRDDVLHLGIEMPDDEGQFFWAQVGGLRLTLRDCLEGDGLNTILDYFSERVQSNKNLVFGDKTIVTVYTFGVDA